MGTWNDNFRTETWTEYAFGIAFIVLRLVARARKLGGVRNWQIDDWIAFQTIFWYTLLIVSLNKVVFGGGSNFMSSDELAALTPETKAERINGSKWVLVSEEAMIMAIWSCKVCMVIIYRRLTYEIPTY
ncbi:hypothetical protein LTR16_010235 [Cryomyces antarcticus]|uniref:Uncharacterized protein n=1 Tax=Cryomyces antarcticus TaxID=329879 RepID=A0ABR0LT84_9PEZI|nr:hypothetical protein LTR16_010235 [Cryomyces antarcticus]